MMVVFVSECEKNSLKKTRRVLDSFADRIGNNVWQTVITLEGLDTVKKLLRKTASKNTAVACHWLRSRTRAELYWVVGNRNKFNVQGLAPVHHTEKNLLNMQWENDWRYLPLIKVLTALAALLHDWGKANIHFQEKLKSRDRKKSDPLRHEWVSYLLLNAFVDDAGNDAEWLERLATGKIDEQKIIKHVCGNNSPREDLPPTAQLLSWLIITHHRLPFLKRDKAKNYCSENSFAKLCELFEKGKIDEKWGYRNREATLKFPHGILAESKQWLRQLRKWVVKTEECLPLVKDCMANGSWRVILHHARLSLMLGDHYYSSLGTNDKWQSDCELYANTQGQPKHLKMKPRMKQKLDEHLVGVMTEALPIVCLLPKVESYFPTLPVDKSHKLQKRSAGKFSWQNKAVDKISKWQQQSAIGKQHQAIFAVNMASTGAGKTFANAKVIHALAGDGLRYILALGLRTLTLQTGDEYRERIGLGKDELAVVIGSQAVVELHESGDKDNTKQAEELEEHIKAGSESQEILWDSELDYENNYIEEEFSKKVLKGKNRDKHKNFFYAPILVCTIDHIIAATETKRGGRYILPSLRLMSSDLVIDEVDDFAGSDLIAIGRLIHLAGMLGRRVMISSATIPPDLAEGYFNAYQHGWQLFCHSRENFHNSVGCIWIDEHDTKIDDIALDADYLKNYRQKHCDFVKKRVAKLHTQTVRRRGKIIGCDDIKDSGSEDSKHFAYYEMVKTTALGLHREHSNVDSKTQKNVSFGMVRVANIDPCIELTKYLLTADWPSSTDVKIMAYHSRQVMLLRSEQEKHLDDVLKLKEEGRNKSFSDPIIRQHLDQSTAKNVIFIVVATPVEEVGRDHDFDWAVVEPSSFRSIIQLAGRVRRHREGAIDAANVALMQYNLKALTNKDDKPVFCRPGFEGVVSNKLETHDLKKLLDETKISERIDATARTLKPDNLHPQKKLADLEHKVIADALINYSGVGPEALQGYFSQCWGLTALPQILQPFRKDDDGVNLYLAYYEDEDRFIFSEKTHDGKPVKKEKIYRIKRGDNNFDHNRLWLQRDYKEALEKIAEQKNLTLEEASLRYGELSFPLYLRKCDNEFIYLDQLGLGKDE